MADAGLHNPVMFSAPPGGSGSPPAGMVAVQAHYRAAPAGAKPSDMSAVTLLTGDPNAVAKTAPPAPPAPPVDPVVGVDPGLGVSVTKSGKSLDAHGKLSPSVSVGKVLDNLPTPILGEPFSQTNVGKAVLHGDLSGFKDSLVPPHGGAGQVNAGMAPFPIKAGGAIDRVVGKVLGAKPVEEAAAHSALLGASAKARAEGFGPEMKVPTLNPGETSPETGGHLGAQVRGAVKGNYPAGKTTVPSDFVPPKDVLFHGSPEGNLGRIDTYHHTRPWEEGIGLYATENIDKAKGYAAGRTARGERKIVASENGAVNFIKLKPEAKVLDMSKPADLPLWEKFKPYGWSNEDFQQYVVDRAGKNPTNQAIRKSLLNELREEYGGDAIYELEESYAAEGIQATTHIEGTHSGQLHRVWVIKDPSIIEHDGSVPLASLQPKEVPLEDPLAGKTAQQVRDIQDTGYSAERGKRITAAAQAFEKEGGGAAGHQAALKELSGELPKLDWQGFKQFDQPAVDALINHVHSLPNMQEFEKTAASNSILDAVSGKVPTHGDQALLERAFGREVTDQIIQGVPFWKATRNIGLELLNVPRAIMSSADLSAPLRQGLVAMVTHPMTSLSGFPQMFKSFGSERVFQEGMDALRNDPIYPLARKSGLPLTDIGKVGNSAKLSTREEQFQSNLAERIPVIGHMIRASDRAYVMFLNKLRIDVFKQLALQGVREGRPTEGAAGEKFFSDLGRFVGSATGRGPLGPFAKHAVSVNATFFSPRLLASRLDILLSPATYLTADPFVRRQALQATFNLVATMSLVLELAHLGGAQVSLDPTSANFGKIRIGNTRIDLAGGFQQPLRLAFELYEGKVTSSTTGTVEKLAPGIGQTSRGDVALRFLFSKFGPVPSFAAQASGVSQANFGPKQSLQSMAMQRLIPLLAQDANDLRTQQGAFGGSPSIEKAIGGYGLGLFGVGMQTYGNQAAGLQGPSSPPAHSDHMFGAPPARGGQTTIVHSSGMFSAPPAR